jgi:shikimate dehydrogenase
MRGKLKITGKTKVFGIFGWPVHHSLSPAMHNAAFRHLYLDGCYLPFAVRPEHLPIAVQAIIPLGLGGINITIPHKEKVISLLQEITPTAKFIGAVNTIEVKSGRLVGHNTDGEGFIRALMEKKVAVSGKKTLILGAGGSAKAVAVQLAMSGASSIIIANRTPDRAFEVADSLKTHFPDTTMRVVTFTPEAVRKELRDSDILVNTTSVGLKRSDPPPIPIDCLHPGLFVYDLIYNPPETPLLRNARVIGAPSMNGLGMLLHQGVLGFGIWTGKKAPVSVMKKALIEAMESHGG